MVQSLGKCRVFSFFTRSATVCLVPWLGAHYSSSLAWTGFFLLGPLLVQSWVTWWLLLWTTPAFCGYFFDRQLPVGGSGFQTWEIWNSVAPIHVPDFRVAWWPQINLGIFVQKDLILVAPVFFFFKLGTETPTNHLGFCLLIFLMVEKGTVGFRTPSIHEHCYSHMTWHLCIPGSACDTFWVLRNAPFISLVENLTPELIYVVKGDSVPATRHKRTKKQAYKHREFSHKCSFLFPEGGAISLRSLSPLRCFLVQLDHGSSHVREMVGWTGKEP